MNYTVSERDMKVTLIAYLEGEGKAELAAIIEIGRASCRERV